MISSRTPVDNSSFRCHIVAILVLLWSRFRERSAGFATPIRGNIVATSSRRVRVFRPELDTLESFSLVSVLPGFAVMGVWMNAMGG